MSIRLHDYQVAKNDRGAADSPVIGVVVGGASINHAEVSFPQQATIERVTDQSLGSEAGDQVLSIRCRRCGCIRILGVTVDPGDRLDLSVRRSILPLVSRE